MYWWISKVYRWFSWREIFSTLMAGIPNAPSVYSLTENPALAEQRQKYVVKQMVKYDYITEDQAKTITK